jgi:hypothetical protein
VDIVKWYERHEGFVNAKTFKSDTRRYWFTHRNVRKAFIHIRRALPDMFHYLDNPNIPKTTNGLESFFGHPKQNISLHRGLSKAHFKNYVKWYLYFKSNEKIRNIFRIRPVGPEYNNNFSKKYQLFFASLPTNLD